MSGARPLKGSGDTSRAGNPRPTKTPGRHLEPDRIGVQLAAFGVNAHAVPDVRQWNQLCRVVQALVNNPSLRVGKDSSMTVFPEAAIPIPPFIDEQIIPSFHVYDIRTVSGVTTCLVQKGWVLGRDPTLGGDAIAAPAPPLISGTAMATTRIVIEATKTLYCRVETDENDIIGSVTIVSETARPTSRHAQPARQDIDMAVTLAAVTGIYYYPIADFVVGPTSRLVVANQYQSGGPIIHIPGRNGHSSSLRIVDCEGTAVAFLNFFQGLETTNLGDQEIECGCDGGTTSSASPAATTYRQEGSEP